MLILLGMFILPSQVQASTLLVDLIAYWSLDETSATRFDSVGANHLADNNDVEAAPGIVGNAAAFEPGFDLSEQPVLGLGDNPDLSNGDIDFTISAWAYLERKTIVHGNNVIVNKIDASNREYQLSFNTDQERFSFAWYGPGNTEEIVRAHAFGSPAEDTWYHLAAWHDAAANTISIQINAGALDTLPEPLGGGQDGTGSFLIGRQAVGEPWIGLIDEVGIWKRVLTAEERTLLYTNPAYLPNLLNPPPVQEPVIPEPSALMLFGSGLVGLIGWRRRRFSG